MKSKRFTLTVLLVLVALETILVDHAWAACDHSKPSGDWVNDWDGLVNYNCGKGKNEIYNIHHSILGSGLANFKSDSVRLNE